jgi:hypothetical protein
LARWAHAQLMVEFPRPAVSDRGVIHLWGQPLVVEQPTVAQCTVAIMLPHGFSSTSRTLWVSPLPGARGAAA